MRTVWKYSIELNPGAVTHQVPVGARLVHAEVQYGVPTLWFEVEPDASLVPRMFTLVGTGHPVGDRLTHVASFLLANGTLVLHAYEVAS